jgi:hypothetical protein
VEKKPENTKKALKAKRHGPQYGYAAFLRKMTNPR